MSIFKKLVDFIFYTDFYYGICAIVMTRGLFSLHGLPPIPTATYGILFSTCILYYLLPHSYWMFGNRPIHQWTSIPKFKTTNDRSTWLLVNYRLVLGFLLSLFVILAISTIDLLKEVIGFIPNLTMEDWAILLFTLIVGLSYYAHSIARVSRFSLRNLPFAKPTAIAIVWVNVVYLFPLILMKAIYQMDYRFLTPNLLFELLYTYILVTMLCILFDLKDFEVDKQKHLATLPIKYGWNGLVWKILLPMLGIITTVQMYRIYQFYPTQYYWLLMPILLLSIVIGNRKKISKIKYYTLIIDSLLLFKGIIDFLL